MLAILTPDVRCTSVRLQIGRWSRMHYYIHFGTNTLSGTVPTELGKLNKLSSYLVLNSNSLSGKIPTELGGMDSLQNE